MMPEEFNVVATPLDGVRVLDLTTGSFRYCGRLLSLLGAQVQRSDIADSGERCSADPQGIFLGSSPFESVTLPPDFTSVGALSSLSQYDILVTDTGPARLHQRGIWPDDVLEHCPDLLYVSISPYGLTGPWADRPATDLTALAAGGLLYLGGDVDRPPVRAFGEQSAIAASLHATTAALMALLCRGDGGGHLIDVSVQEAVAHSIENAAQYFDLENVIRHRAGAGDADAGSGLFRCQDGYVYLLTSMGGVLLGFDRLVNWLEQSGTDDVGQLRSPEWSDITFRKGDGAKAVFTDMFERFAAGRTKQWLYEGGQHYGVSISPVSSPHDLLEDEQLLSRDFYELAPTSSGVVKVPGPPFRFTFNDAAAGSADQPLEERI